jgi:hypothetical protein
MAANQAEKPTDFNGSGSTLATYVEGSEELQSRVKLATSRENVRGGAVSKSVRFGSLELRVYPITLGDNPACSYGPPVRNSSFSQFLLNNFSHS